MKKGTIRQMVSILAAFAVALSCLYSVSAVSFAEPTQKEAPASTTPIKYKTFDFEEATGNWAVTSDDAGATATCAVVDMPFALYQYDASGNVVTDAQGNPVVLKDIATKGYAPNGTVRTNGKTMLALLDEDLQSKSVTSIELDYATAVYWDQISFMYYYLDSKNYNYIEIMLEGSTFALRNFIVRDGVSNFTQDAYAIKDIQKLYALQSAMNRKLVHIKLDFTSRGVLLTLSDLNGNAIGTPSVKISDAIAYKSATIGFFATALSNQVQYIDNLKISYSADDATVVAEFRTLYAALLAKPPAEITLADETRVNEALAYYAMVPATVQNQLAEEYAKLTEMALKIENMRIQNEYGILQTTEKDILQLDFENEVDIKRFYRKGEIPPDSTFTVIEAPDGAVNGETGRVNRVLSATGSQLGVWQFRDFSWPEHASLQSVSFKMKLEDLVASPYRCINLYYSYIDADNYAALNIYQENAEGPYYYRIYRMKDGLFSGDPSYAFDFDLSEWFTVEIRYDAATLGAELRLQSCSDASLMETVNDYVTAASARFAVAEPEVASFFVTDKTGTILYDDIRISFTPGDWDDDVTVEAPHVYYTSNTWLAPGNTAMLYGENLYKTIFSDAQGTKQIALVRQEDAADPGSSEPKYIRMDSYNTSVNEGKFTPAIDAAAHYNSRYADSGQAVLAEIAQATDHSVKFIIPGDWQPGIYAAYIKSANLKSDKVVYLNRPQITSLIGNSGGSSSVLNGTLKLIGQNLAPKYDNSGIENNIITDPAAVAEMGIRVVLTDAKGNRYALPVESVENIYCITVKIPQNIGLTLGDYEISVYNGYGDETAWSMPVGVSIVEDPYEKLNKTRYSVRDYGAYGDGKHIDTAAFVNAIDAASVNGGTVYVPAGEYILTSSLSLPDGVSLVGESTFTSSLLFYPYKYYVNQLPLANIYTLGNSEIANLSMYAQRSGRMITNMVPTYDALNQSENIYVHDVYTRANPTASAPTEGSGAGVIIGGMTAWEVAIELIKESKISTGGTNFQVKNNLQYHNNTIISSLSTLSVQGGGISVCGNSFQSVNGGGYSSEFGGWSGFTTVGGYIADNRWTHQYIASYMDRSYFARNYVGEVLWNNGEILGNDGGLYYGRFRSGIIQYVDDHTYKLCAVSNQIETDRYKGYMLFVQEGNGLSQYRRITSNYSVKEVDKNGNSVYATYVTIEDPFIVKPNRNSRAAIKDAYCETYVVGCEFANGGHVLTYGPAIGLVFDSNTFRSMMGFWMFSYDDGANWYNSIVNTRLYDTYGFQGTGYGDRSGITRIDLESPGDVNVFNCITVRDNNFPEYTSLTLRTTDRGKAMQNVVIENNAFEAAELAIQLPDHGKYCDGIFLHNNTFGESVGTEYGAFVKSVNAVGYDTIQIYGSAAEKLLGDVNQDGSVSLKDSHLILYYLTGRVTLTEEQLWAADVNNSADVTVLDSAIIKRYILGETDILGKPIHITENKPFEEWEGPY